MSLPNRAVPTCPAGGWAFRARAALAPAAEPLDQRFWCRRLTGRLLPSQCRQVIAVSARSGRCGVRGRALTAITASVIAVCVRSRRRRVSGCTFTMITAGPGGARWLGRRPAGCTRGPTSAGVRSGHCCDSRGGRTRQDRCDSHVSAPLGSIRQHPPGEPPAPQVPIMALGRRPVIVESITSRCARPGRPAGSGPTPPSRCNTLSWTSRR